MPTNGHLVATCATCRLTFEVVRGRAIASDTRPIMVRTPRYGYRGENALRYEVRLDLPGRLVEIVRFELPERNSQVVARPGDEVSAIYLRRGKGREQLLSIHNATTGETRTISTLGEKTAATAWWIAGGAALIVYVIVAVADASAPVGISATLGTLLGLRMLLGRLLLPRAKISSDEKRRLDTTRRLLTDRLGIETARGRTIRQLAARRELRERLVSLRARMLDLGLDLYQGRVTAIDRALVLIDTQIDLEIRLCDGYQRAIQMLDIELETGATAIALDDSAEPRLVATLAEMRDLEAQQADVMRKLAANVEIDALLKGEGN